MDTLSLHTIQPPDTLPQNGAAPSTSTSQPPFDPILFWNDVALEANRVSHTNGANEQVGPPLSARALAIVHLAMYDAYVGIVGASSGLMPYLPTLPAPVLAPGEDISMAAVAAVSSAAYTTLGELFPSQKAFFDLILNGVGTLSDGGTSFGTAVAQAILLDRNTDPGVSDTGYKAGKNRGEHRVDPDNPNQGFHAPFYGENIRSFAITARHVLLAPPLDDAEYASALNEVYARGIATELMGTLPDGTPKRTTDETVRGIFWAYDGAAKLGTPPRFFNQIVHQIAVAQGNSISENAQLFALINVAMADAGILAWEQKYIHKFWRPILGIREHDQSTGPGATLGNNPVDAHCDTGWLPLGAPKTNGTGKNFTPPFPAYPSGHATFGAAALHVTRLFFKHKKSTGMTAMQVANLPADQIFDDPSLLHLNVVSEELNGVNQDNHGTVRPRHIREFDDGLWAMIKENGRSRVDLGVHWVFDAFAVDASGEPDLTRNVGGVPLGVAIAKDIFANGMTRSSVMPLPVTTSGTPSAAAMDAAAAEAETVRAETPRGGSWRDRIPYLPSDEVLRITR